MTRALEDTFQVKKGETIYTGSVDLEVEPTDLPNKVEPGEQIKIGVETNLKRKGSCELVMTWPKVGAASGESKMPDNSGRCSWTITVPAELPGDSEANVLITVRKNGSTVRTLTRDFKVR